MGRKSSNDDAHGKLTVLLVLIALAIVGFTSWYVWHAKTNADKTLGSANKITSSVTVAKPKKSTNLATKPVDETDGGRYLYIKEWNVRVALPKELYGKVTYDQIATATDPDTGLPLESTKIYIAKTALDSTISDCAVTPTSLGDSVASGAQYIRSDSSQPFNTSRYKGSLHAHILTAGQYSFHVNSIQPDCYGGSNANLDTELINALEGLKAVS